MSEYDDQSLISLLDDIADSLKEAKSRFPGSTMAAVNRDFLLDLVYSARDIVPDQLSRADELLAEAESVRAGADGEAEKIRDNAHKEAEGIITEAREQASRLVAKDAVTIAAKAEAARIVDDAKSQAEKLRRGADEYSDSTLAKLEQDISSVDGAIADVLSTLRSGFDAIAEQIGSGRSVIAERAGQRGQLRPTGDDAQQMSEDGEEVTIVGPIPPELADSPAEAAVADSVAPSPSAPNLAETAPEPADEVYQ